MPRPKQCRRISRPPMIKGFKPFGESTEIKEEVFLQYDEYEALRLLDYDGLNQEQAAERMNVSRPTLTRIYEKARKAIAKAFVEGTTILIKGGNVGFGKGWERCHQCHRMRNGLKNHDRCQDCIEINDKELSRINKNKTNNMKIAITSEGNTLSANIDPRFGRCAYFAIYDCETKETSFIENPAKESSQGAGAAAVEFVASQKANKVIAGEFGGKIKPLFEKLNIEMVADSGKTIQEIIEQL